MSPPRHNRMQGHALATVADEVSALRSQLATSRAREQTARAALLQLAQAVTKQCPGQLDEELAAAQDALAQLYIDAK